MRDRLKPCPFCGSEQVFMWSDLGRNGSKMLYRVWHSCDNDTTIETALYDTEQGAAEAWNHHVEKTELVRAKNYKEQMKVEYDELCERIEKLSKITDGYITGTLDFELSCPIGLLAKQELAMHSYKEALEERNKIEKAW